MRNKTSFLLAAAFAAACVGSAANAEPIPPTLQARYSALIRAIEKNDLKTYDAFYSADYVSIDPSGKSMSRAEYMAGIRDLMKGAKKTVIKIRYKGATTHDGIVDVAFDVTGKVASSTGVTTFHEIGVDSWKKVGKTWMEIKTVDKVFDVVAPKPKAKPK